MLSAGVETLSLSAEQESAINFVEDNLKKGLVVLSGPAGSGKTTLLKVLVARLEENYTVTVCGTTNKAACVLRRKGLEAITFHQACLRPIFRPPLDKLGNFLEQDLNDEENIEYPDSLLKQYSLKDLKAGLATRAKSGVYAALRQLGITNAMKYIEGWSPAGSQKGVLIVDEASMLGKRELENAQEVYSKIVLVGDENQLEPVKSEPVFWQVPHRVTLTEIHRQAEGSQPLDLATTIRTGGKIESGALSNISLKLCRAGMPVIVWRNKTRVELTNVIREALGYAGMPPQVGETLICRNISDRGAKDAGLSNNSLWTVIKSDPFMYSCDLQSDDGETVLEDISVHVEELETGDGIPFRFGYCLTGHNSQGSAFDTVQIHHGDTKAFFSFKPAEARKFLYTAVTRAVSRVVFVSSKVA